MYIYLRNLNKFVVVGLNFHINTETLASFNLACWLARRVSYAFGVCSKITRYLQIEAKGGITDVDRLL